MQTKMEPSIGTESRKPHNMTVTTKDHFMQIFSICYQPTLKVIPGPAGTTRIQAKPDYS